MNLKKLFGRRTTSPEIATRPKLTLADIVVPAILADYVAEETNALIGEMYGTAVLGKPDGDEAVLFRGHAWSTGDLEKILISDDPTRRVGDLIAGIWSRNSIGWVTSIGRALRRLSCDGWALAMAHSSCLALVPLPCYAPRVFRNDHCGLTELLLFKPGELRLTVEPHDKGIEFATDSQTKEQIMFSRMRIRIGLAGLKWAPIEMAGVSPANKELAMLHNWKRN